MNEIIHETTPTTSALFSAYTGSEHFIKDVLLKVVLRSDCWRYSVVVASIANAQKRGAVCPSFDIEFKNAEHGDSTGLAAADTFLTRYGNRFSALLEELLALPWKCDRWGGFEAMPFGSAIVHRSERQGVRVYSPFAQIPPLKSRPTKWTVGHVVRALWNGQFEYLRCNGVYTDDYAHDAAVNFREGLIANSRGFVRRLIESPSGWWASSDSTGSDVVGICCCHFDSNSFKFALNPPKTAGKTKAQEVAA